MPRRTKQRRRRPRDLIDQRARAAAIMAGQPVGHRLGQRLGVDLIVADTLAARQDACRIGQDQRVPIVGIGGRHPGLPIHRDRLEDRRCRLDLRPSGHKGHVLGRLRCSPMQIRIEQVYHHNRPHRLGAHKMEIHRLAQRKQRPVGSIAHRRPRLRCAAQHNRRFYRPGIIGQLMHRRHTEVNRQRPAFAGTLIPLASCRPNAPCRYSAKIHTSFRVSFPKPGHSSSRRARRGPGEAQSIKVTDPSQTSPRLSLSGSKLIFRSSSTSPSPISSALRTA